MNPTHGLKTLGIRQSKVNQGDIRPSACKGLEGLLQGLAMDNLGLEIGNLSERLLHQPLVARVVFQQQNLDFGHQHIGLIYDGSLTRVSQKFSMDCATRRNWSRSTGFVM